MNWDQIEGNWKQFKGKVKERKHIPAYGYERPQASAPRYTSAYASEDNCDQSAGY